MKEITILGVSGSIGQSAIQCIRDYPHLFKLRNVSVNVNIESLKTIIEEFSPHIAVIRDETAYKSFLDKYASEIAGSKYKDTEILCGEKSLIDIAGDKCDITLSAIVGFAGLKPTIASIKAGNNIALANKESLVAAGDIISQLVKEHNVNLIPVDSEHSALFLLLKGIDRRDVKRLIITASGGPFRNSSREKMKNVSLEDALKHPTWKMGSKITIDSATMFNKGLEIIEAHHLFNIDYDKIDIIIHPESIIHSMIETIDNAITAIMGESDMKYPILKAFSYPNTIKGNTKVLSLAGLSLNFEAWYRDKFPMPFFCYEAGYIGGTMPVAINAANEVAVWKFLNKEISFLDIERYVKYILNIHKPIMKPCLEDIINTHEEIIKRLSEPDFYIDSKFT